MNPELNFCGLHSDHLGYGIHYTALLNALQKIGIDTYDGLPGSPDLDASVKQSKICKDICYLAVPGHVGGWFAGQRPHLYTMVESTGLPEAWRETLHNYKTLIVPSQQCKRTFAPYHDNIHVVPLGIDASVWGYKPRQESQFFNFFTIGSGERKNVDMVHKAFLEIFGHGRLTDGPVPQLIIKTYRKEIFDGPNVRTVTGVLPEKDLVSLYESAHCYVSASRGEGFGLMPCQAIAQGIPTILPNAHGHAEFAQYGIPIKATPAKATYLEMFGEAGEWWEPDYDELCEAMARVYVDYAQELTIAKQNSEAFCKRFTWENAAEKLVTAIGGREALSERLETTPTHWFERSEKKFKVKTLRNWRADIGGTVYRFEGGIEYVESADVKRILFEAGILDTSYMDAADGLTESQCETLALRSSAVRTCSSCHQEIPWPPEEDDDEEDDAAFAS